MQASCMPGPVLYSPVESSQQYTDETLALAQWYRQRNWGTTLPGSWEPALNTRPEQGLWWVRTRPRAPVSHTPRTWSSGFPSLPGVTPRDKHLPQGGAHWGPPGLATPLHPGWDFSKEGRGWAGGDRSAHVWRNYPRPGEKLQEIIRKNSIKHSHKAENITCCHQPNWKTS